MKVKLNDAWLRAAKPPPEGRIEVTDLGCKGLSFRLTSGGAASWCARVVLPSGKGGRVTIGEYPAIGLAEARRKAEALRVAAASGAGPIAEKRAKREQAQERLLLPTVEDRWREWSAIAGRTAMKGRGWSDNHAERVAWMLTKIVGPTIGKKPLVETKREDWTGLVSKMHERGPAAAGNFLRIAAAFLSHAEAAGWIPLPLLPRKASRLAPPVAPRERVLDDEELAKVWKGAEALPPKACAFTRLLILTACRRGEVAGIALGEVDRDAGLWRLPRPRTKGRRAHVVPLGPLALEALAEVWPADAEDRDPSHRLLGRYGDAPMSGFSKPKDDLDRASGVVDWDWHDLRRTARTGMSRLGVPREAAEAALNHAPAGGLVGVYDRHGFADEAIAAIRRWQEHVAGLVAPQPDVPAAVEPHGSNVVLLRPRARA